MANLRILALSLIRRDIESRHKGTFGGLYWYVIQNVILLAIYSSVFGTIFRARWSEQGVGEANFTLALFVGLIMYNLLAECLNRAPQLILQNVNLVKKVVFPLEILPVVSVGSALFNMTIAFGVLLAAAVVLRTPLSWGGLWLPVIVAPLAILSLGLSWFLASLGTYLRDVGQLIAVVIVALMFLSPLFYPASALPEEFRPFLLLNPITVPMEQARAVLLFGRQPDFVLLLVYWAAALVIAALGFHFFQRTRKGFADVV